MCFLMEKCHISMFCQRFVLSVALLFPLSRGIMGRLTAPSLCCLPVALMSPCHARATEIDQIKTGRKREVYLNLFFSVARLNDTSPSSRPQLCLAFNRETAQ